VEAGVVLVGVAGSEVEGSHRSVLGRSPVPESGFDSTAASVGTMEGAIVADVEA